MLMVTMIVGRINVVLTTLTKANVMLPALQPPAQIGGNSATTPLGALLDLVDEVEPYPSNFSESAIGYANYLVNNGGEASSYQLSKLRKLIEQEGNSFIYDGQTRTFD